MIKAISGRLFFLIVLFVCAFSLRMFFINKGPFHYDTLDLAISAQKTLDTRVLHYEHGTGYPLTVICGAFFIFIFRFFGAADPVFCVNFMSVLMGAISVILLFFLVERLFDFDRAVLSAALWVFFMPHVAISTFGKSLTLSICFSLASAYCMLVYTQSGKHRYLVYSALFLGFCAAARLSDILVFAPIVFLYFSSGKIDYVKIRAFIVFLVLFFLVVFIYYLPTLLDHGLNQFVDVWRSRGGAQFIGVTSGVFIFNLSWMWKIFSVIGITFVLMGFGCMFLRRLYRPFIFLAVWFLVMFTFYAGISSSGPRYLVIAWIPLMIAQGYFLGDFKGKKVVLFAVFFFIVFVNFVKYAPVLTFRHCFSLQKEFAEWVDKKTPADAVIITMDESIFMAYYGHRTCMSRPIFENKRQIEDFFKHVDTVLAERKNVYIISTAYLPYDLTHTFRKSLFKRYNMILIGKKINEDWHFSLLDQLLFKERLYKIEKKYV